MNTNIRQRSLQRSLGRKDYRIYMSEADSESEDEDGRIGPAITISSSRQVQADARASLCTGFHVERRIGYLGQGQKDSNGALYATPLYNDSSLNGACCSSDSYWTASEVAKAGRILAKPPMVVSFADEEEMRRIYGLIYDTFRYKHVLQKILDSVNFYQMNPGLEQDAPRLWLLLFVMILRHFTSHNDQDSRHRQYAVAGMSLLDEKLTAIRIRLGAALSRLRIEHGALRLTQLLPGHVAARSSVFGSCSARHVACWTGNGFESRQDVNVAMIQLGLKLVQDEGKALLDEGEYRFDPIFPNYIECHAPQRSVITSSQFVKSRQLTVLNRAFCVSSVMFCKILENRDLYGYVVQTNVVSARSTAYLAKCLTYNLNVMGLLVFNAGKKKRKYDRIFDEYEFLNIKVYAGSLQEECVHLACNGGFPLVAALVTPRCSLSFVRDSLDLAVARGGDITVLQNLTNLHVPPATSRFVHKQKLILKSTLEEKRFDFVLYATHSLWCHENEDVVQDVLKALNENTHLSNEDEIREVRPFNSSGEIEEPIEIPEYTYSVADLPDIFSAEDYKKFGSKLRLLQRYPKESSNSVNL